MLGAAFGLAAPAVASNGVLYGKSADVHKARRDYEKRKAHRRTAHHSRRYACRHHRSYRHHVVRRRHQRAKHIVDIAVVKAAYIRRPGGRWKLVKARVRAAKVFARRRDCGR